VALRVHLRKGGQEGVRRGSGGGQVFFFFFFSGV
jgi:hypothetical protein